MLLSADSPIWRVAQSRHLTGFLRSNLRCCKAAVSTVSSRAGRPWYVAPRCGESWTFVRRRHTKGRHVCATRGSLFGGQA